MEKDKSRGIKHIKDKKKYKGNSTKNPKYLPPKTIPKLESNWDRYELTDDNIEHKLNSSTDFAILSNAPISTGSHFQFKSDKLNEEQEHVEEKNDLFFLNLDLLNEEILTIPFYERMGIPKTHFQKHEIDRMDKNAAKHLEKYKTRPNAQNVDQTTLVNNEATEITNIEEPKFKEQETVPNTQDVKQDNDILELIENVSIDEGHKDVEISISTEQKSDLEDWLDDILDD